VIVRVVVSAGDKWSLEGKKKYCQGVGNSKPKKRRGITTLTPYTTEERKKPRGGTS